MKYSFCNCGPALFWFIFYETQWPLMIRGVTWGGGVCLLWNLAFLITLTVLSLGLW